jgi:transposase, IS5 family
MRKRKDSQLVLELHKPSTKESREYYGRYESISGILDETPRILDLVHADIESALEAEERNEARQGRKFSFTSENVLRIVLCQIIEGESLRGVVVQIDGNIFLRRFTRINDGKMMANTTLCRLKNHIQPETWKKINHALGKAAAQRGQITGDKLRLDTTAFETNIHYPTDSGLLWDTYRVLAGLIAYVRGIDPDAVGPKRAQRKCVKKLRTTISRKAGKKKSADSLKKPYEELCGYVESILIWEKEVRDRLRDGLRSDAYTDVGVCMAEYAIEELEKFAGLGARVLDQAKRRVFDGEQVPSDEKIFSIFESHTELLKRGKAGKPIEFGHMIGLQQTAEKFITDFEVFDKKPNESELVEPALKSHEKLFGRLPEELSADKGYYASMTEIGRLEKKIPMVAIGKKGKRNAKEDKRESSVGFKLAQAFRAGIEGSISFLKRTLRFFCCFNKGLEHYHATVGATIVAHNLIILART